MTSLPQTLASEVVLRPQRTSTCTLPRNLRAEELDLFSHECETALPPTRLLEMRDVSMSSDGYLFQGLHILPQSFAFPFLQEKWKQRSLFKFLAVNYLRKRRPLESGALFITDDWSTGYFHWLSDVLPKLYLVRDRLKDLVLVLPHQLEKLEFVQSSLRAFDVANSLFLSEGETILCHRIFVPTAVAPSGRYDGHVIKRVRDRIVGFYGGSSTPHDLIYLSRSKARKRQVANEAEVISLLKPLGFRIVNAEDCSFEKQVKLASAARCIISNHGAGLTNILFMNPGMNVLELRHRADRTNNCYFALSSAMGLNYFYQTCHSAGADEDPHSADITVDIPTLKQNVEAVLTFAQERTARSFT